MTRGTLYAVGLGPGEPDLLTLRGRRVLEQVPAVFAAARHAAGRSYALELATPFLDPGRQRIEVLPFPADAHAERIIDVMRGHDVAFLTEGDPLFYSSFIGVLGVVRRRDRHAQVCVVPGVCSPMAAAALAGLPLARDDQQLAVVPAMHALDRLSGVLRDFDTVVLLKISPVLERVLDEVDAAGLGDTAVHVRRVGRPEQSVIVGSAAIRQAPPPVTDDYFSLLIVQRRP
ncbi:MAG TPA: precorrin-2 C(20)-methyltransferase [Chloroflexota bacterium]|jgi:precorrin-2/cobalt-factor-2 C20-methyltransferase|nr:precorrin-2 C(20)-methyltransferase [Chloroflexota bacterium]